MKKILMSAFMLLSVCAFAQTDGVLGFWTTFDEKTDLAKSVVYVYEYEGKVYARILKTFEADGVTEKDNLFLQKYPAEVEGEFFITANGAPAYFAGLDFLYDMVKDGKEYKGEILNPSAGKIYKSIMKLDPKTGNLIVKGHLKISKMLSKTQVWKRAENPLGADLDATTFIPQIPQVKEWKDK